MDNKKVYILQKDLPDYSAGEEFVFNGEHYEAKNKCEDGCVGRWSKKYVEDNPESWEPETRTMNKNEVVAPEMFPMVSYKEYLQFGEDCFNAARKNNSEWYYKFKNFSDYMNSQKPNE